MGKTLRELDVVASMGSRGCAYDAQSMICSVTLPDAA